MIIYDNVKKGGRGKIEDFARQLKGALCIEFMVTKKAWIIVDIDLIRIVNNEDMLLSHKKINSEVHFFDDWEKVLAFDFMELSILGGKGKDADKKINNNVLRFGEDIDNF